MKNNIIVLLILSMGLISVTYPLSAQSKVTEAPDSVLNEVQGNNVEILDDEFIEMEAELNAIETKNAKGDTTRIRIGKMKIAVLDDGKNIIINKDDELDEDDFDEDWTWEDEGDDDWNFSRKSTDEKFKPHWAGFSLGLNNYVTSDGGVTMPDEYQLLAVNTNNSLEVNVNVAQMGFNIVKRHVGLVTGVGFKWNNYKYRNTNTVLVSDSTPLYFYENTEMDGKMSKLTTWYLIVPVLLEFQIPTQGNVFYLSAGVEGGLKLDAHSKIKTNDKSKYKDKSDFFTTSLDYRLAARMGYGNFGIYATYGMMSLFEKDNGPELHPVSVGVSLNF